MSDRPRGPSVPLEARLPPQNLEAEQGVLGGLLRDNGRLHEVVPILRPEDFYRDSHEILYRAIRDLYDAGRPVEPLLLAEELRRRGEFETVGGDRALFEILEGVPHAANTLYHAQIVREKAVARQLIECAGELLREGYSHAMTADELLESAERRIFQIAEGQATGSLRRLPEAAREARERLERRRGADGEYGGLSTGFVDLDDLNDGLADGSLVILAARPSMGKTAFALNVCEHAVHEARVPTLFVSLEMTSVEVAERMMVGRSGVDGHRIRGGRGLTPADDRALARASSEMDTWEHFFVEDAPARTASQIAAAARRVRSRYGLGLVVVDYLQLIEPPPDAERRPRHEQVAGVSRRLKALARELRVPVVALSQLNRGAENREDRRPRLADLRESGAIEQDADLVLLLHRPEYYDSDDQPGIAELIVSKNRNGRTGTIKLTFLKHLARFENHAEPVPGF